MSDNQVRIDIKADASGVKSGVADATRELDNLKGSATGASGAAGALKDAMSGAAEAMKEAAAEATGLSSNTVSALARLGGTLGVIAAGAVAAYEAYSDGQREMAAMNLAIEKTGNYAGVTRDQLRTLAAEMARDSQLTVGQAKDLATALVSAGQVGGAAFSSVAMLAGDFARVMEVDVSRAAPMLSRLFADPEKGARELNQTLHFLTAAQMEQIGAMKDAGDESGAQAALADALKKKLDDVTDAIGRQTGFWLSLKKTASEAWDYISGIGRDEDNDQRIRDLEQKLAPGRGIFAGLSAEEASELENRRLWKTQREDAARARSASGAAEIAEEEQTRRLLDVKMRLSGVNKAFYQDLRTLHAEYQKTGDIDAYRAAVERLIATQTALGREAARKPKTEKKTDLDRFIELGQKNQMADFYKYRGDDDAATFSAAAIAAAEERSIKAAQKQEDAYRKAWEAYERDAARAAERAAEKQDREFQRSADDINRALTDAIMDGGQSGGELLQRYFANLILRPVISAVMDPVAMQWAGVANSATEGIGDWLRTAFSAGYGDAIGLAAGVPQYAAGTPYVPNDGLAYLHRGERVLTADENKGFGGISITVIESQERAGQIQQGADRDGNRELTIWIARFKSEIKAEIASDIDTGNGPIPTSMSRRFGMSPVPY